MDSLVAIPHEDGLKILNDKLFEKIQKFSLIDDKGKVYYQASIHTTYFDADSVLTVVCIVPKEENFTNWNKHLRILTDDDIIIADIQTPAIQFVTGVGGEQVIKLTVSGEASTVVFKKDEYITISEADELLIETEVVNLTFLSMMGKEMIKDTLKRVQ
jgi:hypothetical protein